MIEKQSKATIELIKKAFKQSNDLFAQVISGDRETGDQFKPYEEQTISITVEVSFTISKKEYDNFIKNIQ